MLRPTTRILFAVAIALNVAGLSYAATSESTEANTSLAKTCAGLPAHNHLQAALEMARAQSNGGFNLDMWGAVVNRDGIVCAVAFTGANRGSQWPGSRAIAAQKANTANAFSLPGTLYGLQHSNPVDTTVAYRGPAANFGQEDDPMIGERIGGVNVFGGGLALYTSKGILIGAVGVSGDTSCADHNIAWRTRHTLNLDFVPAGVSAAGDDNINYQGLVTVPSLAHDFSHPICKIAGVDNVSSISANLPPVQKVH